MSEERSNDHLKHSLDELFSGYTPPAPNGTAAPVPAEPPARRPPETEVGPRPARLRGPTVLGFQMAGLTIRARLFWSFGIILILLLIGGAINTVILQQLGQANEALSREGERAVAALQMARASADLLAILGAAVGGDPDEVLQSLAEARVTLADARTRLSAAVADLPTLDPRRLAASRVQARVARVDSLVDLITPAVRQAQWDRVQYYQSELLTDYHQTVVQSVDEIVRLTQEQQAVAAGQVTAARRIAGVVPAVVVVLTLIVAGGTVISFVRTISGPVERLAHALSLLAGGHLDERVPVERQDELGALAAALNQMADRLQRLYTELEDRVAERTRALQEANYALQRRAIQLEASADIGRAITSIFDVDQLLRQTIDLINNRFGFYHAGIFLLDESGEWAVLREATGEAGAKMKAQGHRLKVEETSMVGWTAVHRQPRIALDVGEDAVHFANPLLPHSRSEMTLPLVVGGRLLGVLDVQSHEENAFDSDDVRALQSMADQIAIAIENARRVSAEASLLEATSPLYRASRAMTTALSPDDVLDALLSVISGTEALGCVVGLFEPSDGQPEVIRIGRAWRRDRRSTMVPGVRTELREDPTLLQYQQQWIFPSLEEADLLPASSRAIIERAGAQSVANFPLLVGGRPIGFFFVYRAERGLLSDATRQLYETLAGQAAVALERARLLEITRQQAQSERLTRELAERFRGSLDVDATLRAAVREIGRVLGGAEVTLLLQPARGGDGHGEEEVVR